MAEGIIEPVATWAMSTVYNFFREKAVEKLKEGDVTELKFREMLMQDLEKIQESLDALRNKEFGASKHRFNMAIRLIKSKDGVISDEVKNELNEVINLADIAFEAVKDAKDKVDAAKIASTARLIKDSDDPKHCKEYLEQYLDRVNKIPEVVGAAEVQYSTSAAATFKRRFNTKERESLISLVGNFNRDCTRCARRLKCDISKHRVVGREDFVTDAYRFGDNIFKKVSVENFEPKKGVYSMGYSDGVLCLGYDIGLGLLRLIDGQIQGDEINIGIDVGSSKIYKIHCTKLYVFAIDRKDMHAIKIEKDLKSSNYIRTFTGDVLPGIHSFDDKTFYSHGCKRESKLISRIFRFDENPSNENSYKLDSYVKSMTDYNGDLVVRIKDQIVFMDSETLIQKKSVNFRGTESLVIHNDIIYGSYRWKLYMTPLNSQDSAESVEVDSGGYSYSTYIMNDLLYVCIRSKVHVYSFNLILLHTYDFNCWQLCPGPDFMICLTLNRPQKLILLGTEEGGDSSSYPLLSLPSSE